MTKTTKQPRQRTLAGRFPKLLEAARQQYMDEENTTTTEQHTRGET